MGRFPASKEAMRRRRRCPFASARVSFPWSSFRVPNGPFGRGEGLTPFSYRGRLSTVPSDPGGRGASLREKGNAGVHGPGARGAYGKRQADRSDVRHEYVRLKEPDPASSLWLADGRQPFMPANISQSLPSSLIPSVSPIARRMRPHHRLSPMYANPPYLLDRMIF
jgi:hypothetical protein